MEGAAALLMLRPHATPGKPAARGVAASAARRSRREGWNARMSSVDFRSYISLLLRRSAYRIWRVPAWSYGETRQVEPLRTAFCVAGTSCPFKDGICAKIRPALSWGQRIGEECSNVRARDRCRVGPFGDPPSVRPPMEFIRIGPPGFQCLLRPGAA